MLKKEKIVLSDKLLVLTIKMEINSIIFKFLIKEINQNRILLDLFMKDYDISVMVTS